MNPWSLYIPSISLHQLVASTPKAVLYFPSLPPSPGLRSEAVRSASEQPKMHGSSYLPDEVLHPQSRLQRVLGGTLDASDVPLLLFAQSPERMVLGALGLAPLLPHHDAPYHHCRPLCARSRVFQLVSTVFEYFSCAPELLDASLVGRLREFGDFWRAGEWCCVKLPWLYAFVVEFGSCCCVISGALLSCVEPHCRGGKQANLIALRRALMLMSVEKSTGKQYWALKR